MYLLEQIEGYSWFTIPKHKQIDVTANVLEDKVGKLSPVKYTLMNLGST
jgi:hypothetical protein